MMPNDSIFCIKFVTLMAFEETIGEVGDGEKPPAFFKMGYACGGTSFSGVLAGSAIDDLPGVLRPIFSVTCLSSIMSCSGGSSLL